MAKKMREQRPKARREWTRSPVTQVEPNRREYDRATGTKDVKQAFEDLRDPRYASEPLLQNEQGRVVGIDYGLRRLGIAVSDPFMLIAQGIETIESRNQADALSQIAKLIQDYESSLVVIGLPINMDGTEGKMAQEVHAFARKIEERTGSKVLTWDERLTSTAAERTMTEMGRSTRGRKSEIDRIAATLILQGFLDHNRQSGRTSDAGRGESLCPE
ncbi:MAG: Holliday junction resolvase RuvX [Candidatus Latescibacteria bacterium]|jgi:putative holliday junction resolvase|nr:Holliday junction resolvase RuvX [Candidatus Latescibacterota bacterium]